MSYNDFEQCRTSIETRKAGTPQRFLYPQVEINANPIPKSHLPRNKTPVHDINCSYIKTIPFLGWFFLYLHHGKEHQIFGIRAIEAIQSGATVDKVYIQRKQVAN
jgi:hypothetical protein